MKHLLIATLLITLPVACSQEDGFTPLMDGTSFEGWKMATENTDTWKIEDGAFVANGKRCHLFYEGDGKPFRNFHLKVEVMTEPNSNGGIYFHTRYQESGWPHQGIESQVNVTQRDWIKTGSLYGLVNVSRSLSSDQKWWLHEIIVEGKQVTVKVDGEIVLQYTEPEGAQPGKPYT
ncbi:MAG: 3-keto-disaccharide hydrolase, partial [Verrucomicrobiales bacterium]